MTKYEKNAMHPYSQIVTSLGKEVMFLVELVCRSVCLSVNNITQKLINGLTNCYGILWQGPGW